MNLLDKSGLTYFWGKIKAQFLSLSGGTMTGTIVTPANSSKGIEPATDSYGRIGSGSKRYKEMNALVFYGELHSKEQGESTYVSPAVITLDNRTIDRTMSIYPNDVVLSGEGSDTTWDGVNTSLQGAIYAVNNKVDNLDERLSLDIADFYGNQTTVASGTSVKNIGSFKNTTAGRYMIIVSVIWSGNANGYRVAYLSNTSAGTNIDRFAVDSRMAVNGEQTIQSFSEIMWLNENTTYYITGKQNSGSSLTAYWGVKALRIPH